MLRFIKTIFSGGKEPQQIEVEPIEFKDGLLRLKADGPLPLKKQMVLTKCPAGLVETVLDVQSYDDISQTYLADLPEAREQLDELGVSVNQTTRVLRTLAVTGPALPEFGGFTEDISVGGMRLSTAELLEVGSVHQLTVKLDNSAKTKLKLKAKVTWSAHKANGTCHSGLRFQEVDSATLQLLIRFVRARHMEQPSM